MNKSRFLAILLSSCLIISMTGCASAIPELTEDEQAVVTQYMADLLLKYDANYRETLLDEEELASALAEQRAKEEKAKLEALEQERYEQEQLEASQPDDIQTDKVTHYVTVEEMAEASGLENMEIDYIGYETAMQYPEMEAGELGFAMLPDEGNELVIFKFNIVNISGNDCEIDMISSGTNYAVKINDGKYRSALATLFANDLSMLVATIPVETGMEVVLISEVPIGTQIDSVVLYVSTQNGNKEIQLQ